MEEQTKGVQNHLGLRSGKNGGGGGGDAGTVEEDRSRPSHGGDSGNGGGSSGSGGFYRPGTQIPSQDRLSLKLRRRSG